MQNKERPLCFEYNLFYQACMCVACIIYVLSCMCETAVSNSSHQTLLGNEFAFHHMINNLKIIIYFSRALGGTILHIIQCHGNYTYTPVYTIHTTNIDKIP